MVGIDFSFFRKKEAKKSPLRMFHIMDSTKDEFVQLQNIRMRHEM